VCQLPARGWPGRRSASGRRRRERRLTTIGIVPPTAMGTIAVPGRGATGTSPPGDSPGIAAGFRPRFQLGGERPRAGGAVCAPRPPAAENPRAAMMVPDPRPPRNTTATADPRARRTNPPRRSPGTTNQSHFDPRRRGTKRRVRRRTNPRGSGEVRGTLPTSPPPDPARNEANSARGRHETKPLRGPRRRKRTQRRPRGAERTQHWGGGDEFAGSESARGPRGAKRSHLATSAARNGPGSGWGSGGRPRPRSRRASEGDHPPRAGRVLSEGWRPSLAPRVGRRPRRPIGDHEPRSDRVEGDCGWPGRRSASGRRSRTRRRATAGVVPRPRSARLPTGPRPGSVEEAPGHSDRIPAGFGPGFQLRSQRFLAGGVCCAPGWVGGGRGSGIDGRGQRAEGKWQRANGRGQRTEGKGEMPDGRGQSAENKGQRTEVRARNGRTARRAERTDGTVWFASLGGRGSGIGGLGTTKPGPSRRETNPLRKGAGGWGRGRGPSWARAAARNEPKLPRPLVPAVRNEANGALGGLGKPCRQQARIRNEPNGMLEILGKSCWGPSRRRTNPRRGVRRPKRTQSRPSAPPKRTQSRPVDARDDSGAWGRGNGSGGGGSATQRVVRIGTKPNEDRPGPGGAGRRRGGRGGSRPGC
jgi:hypothetical protein